MSILNLGRIVKGERRSPATEFKPGQHWRVPQPFRENDWLRREYLEKGRSTGDIAAEFGVCDTAIQFWLKKHKIRTRTVAEIRATKHWGVSGPANPMFGRRGSDSPNWKGGHTPERQAFYASKEWTIACRSVWARDKATCRRCSHRQKNGERAMDIHHVVSFSVAALRAEISNLVLLCRACHRFVHSRKNVAKEFLA